MQKAPIGKLLLEKKKISQAQLGAALERQRKAGGRLVSILLEIGATSEEELLRALSEQLGVPAVDLAACILPLSAADLVPQPVAVQAGILAIGTKDDRVLLAMANPQDQQTLDEVKFVTGKKVEPYVVIETRLRNVVHEVYAVRMRDPRQAFWRGMRAQEPAGGVPPEGVLAILAPELPEPDVSLAPDEEILSIEVDVTTSQEVLQSVIGAAPAAPPAAQAGQKTILVVDDEPDIVRMLEKALSTEGYRVVTASRGLEALQAVKAHDPSLVLLDAMLPEIHGFEICKKIKTSKRFGHIPVIMISAVYRGWRYALDAKEAYGADDYFEKPFRLVQLLRRVREICEHDAGAPPAEPEQANAAYQRGVALYREKKLVEAEAVLREALQLDPFSANVHYALANVLLAKNMVYEAIQAFESTIELKPELFAPLRSLAVLYQKKGFRNKAVEMWERALRCAPEGERQTVKEQLLKLLG
jgi:DNA-binding response OmpR family regulator